MKSMITAEDWSPSGKLYGMMVHLFSALSKLTKHKSFEEFKKKKKCSSDSIMSVILIQNRGGSVLPQQMTSRVDGG